MAIQFDFYHSPSPADSTEETEKYHARVVGGQTLNMDTLVHQISSRCTLSKGDIQAVLSELSDELANGLLAGNRVEIPGIGHFSLSLQAPKDAHPKTTHAQNIHVKRIEYRADTQLKKRVEAESVFIRSKEKVHSTVTDLYEVDALLIDYFEENTFITRARFAELCGMTRTTAIRHLRRLVGEGRLINVDTPHHPIYQPAKGYYNRA